MLQESDEALAQTLRRYLAHHVVPHVERYLGRRRILDALIGAGGTIVDDDTGEFALPPELVEEGVAAALIVFCEEHQVPELDPGMTPERVEEWLDSRRQGNA